MPEKQGAVGTSTTYEGLDDKKNTIKQERELLKTTPTEWFRLSVPQKEAKNPIQIYRGYEFEAIVNLKTLKEERLKKEALELKALEETIKSLLNVAEKEIGQRQAGNAEKTLAKILDKIVKVKDAAIHQRHKQLQTSFSNLVVELEREKLERLAEERKRKEEEERRKREEEEKARKKQEIREQAERERREAEARRLAEEARRKEQKEQEERQRLESLSSELKDDWQNILQVLEENGIRYLYHFTDKRNIPSIIRHGGLLSWHYCDTHNIKIPCQGGDYDSRELDKKYGLEDYVRLSFCDDHPMMYRLKQSGSEIKLLKIKIDVALLKDTQFSDINAADKLHTHGKSLEHLKMVDFDATKMHYVSKESPSFKPHQAEVMVKTFVPLKYIVNI